MRVPRRIPIAPAGVAALCLLAVAAPWLPVADPNVTGLDQRLLAPWTDASHPLGTDALGRDLLSRLLHGLRSSLAVGLAAALLATAVGSLIGLVAGYARRATDAVLMRGMDLLMAFPYLLLALAIVTLLGPGRVNALFAIAVANIPFFARAVRGVTVSVASADYVAAARLGGASHARILFQEVLPNVSPMILITFAATLGWMILETAGLSFLGLGAQPPQADLGAMLGEGRQVMVPAPHVAWLPGLLILVLVLFVNRSADALRDRFDPRAAGAGGPALADTPVPPVSKGAAQDSPPASDRGLVAEQLRIAFEGARGRPPMEVVRDAALAVRPGECIALVGESGSGKTVVTRALARLLGAQARITAGQVWLEGEAVFALDREALRRVRGRGIGYVFQDPATSLNPLLSIGEQLVEGLGHARREALASARAALRRVGLADLEHRLDAYPFQLSGGQRQRVALASALLRDPRVLVADEPTTALDVTTQSGVLEDLRAEVTQRSLALIFITHDLAVAAKVADRIVVLYHGEVVESGPLSAVLREPWHPYTRGLLDSSPRLHGPRLLPGIPGAPPATGERAAACAFAPRCPRAQPVCRAQRVDLVQHGERAVRCVLAGEGV